MKKLSLYTISVLTIALSLSSMPSYAGKIYRFLDENGVSTISKRLPPYAAQQGYDILDEKSLRLIEHVLTRSELVEQTKAEQLILQAKQQEQEQRALEKQRQKEQNIIDQNLLDRYPSDQDIIKARDADLAYIDKQIADTIVQKEYNQEKLHRLQQDAAKQELAGQTVSSNLTQRIQATQKEINNNQLHIDTLKNDKMINNKQFEHDLIRLRELQGVNMDAEITE